MKRQTAETISTYINPFDVPLLADRHLVVLFAVGFVSWYHALRETEGLFLQRGKTRPGLFDSEVVHRLGVWQATQMVSVSS